MRLTLIQGSMEHKQAITDMIKEWADYNSAHRANLSPRILFNVATDNFSAYLASLNCQTPPHGFVPFSTYFCMDEATGALIGAVNIRHRLNDALLYSGGHIGDGIRPAQRGKGYGTALVALALDKCRDMGMNRVLMTCSKTNIASAKTILRNGGILENEVEHEGDTVQRYWIHL